MPHCYLPSERSESTSISRLHSEPLNGLFHSYFPRVPLAVPQWSSETYRAMARCLFSGGVVEGPDLAKLKVEIVNTLGVADAVLCGSGSLALEWVLRVCGVGEGDEVVLPTFCCTAVVPPILAVGATPVLADVGVELNITAATVEGALTTHYLNGRANGAASMGFGALDQGSPLRIGLTDDLVNPFKGMISEILIYNRALNQSEIRLASTYLAGRNGVVVVQAARL